MSSTVKNARSTNNVTNLDEVRQAKAQKAEALEQSAESPDGIELKIPDDVHGNRRFDAEKVARIKAAIAAGEYKVDASRVADKFIEHDRNQ